MGGYRTTKDGGEAECGVPVLWMGDGRGVLATIDPKFSGNAK